MEVRKRGHCGGSWECLCASVCCFLPLSVQCGRQMQSVYFYFSPWIPRRGHFLHRSLRDRSDSPTPVRSAAPAGRTRAAPDAAAWIFTLVNHVQTSPFYHHHCRRFMPPRLLHRFLLRMAVRLLSLNGPHVCRWGLSSCLIGNQTFCRCLKIILLFFFLIG